ncbi:MAG: GNAT family N-acetyltransferase [Pseudomonadota bacterium]
MELELEELKPKDLPEAVDLIDRSFSDAVAPILNKEGVATFKNSLTIESLGERLNTGNLIMVCKSAGVIIGVAEVRDENHLNLLFVDPSKQRSGIGRRLLDSLIDRIEHRELTVNSSLNSIDAYAKYGFQESGSVCEVQGIRYQPMMLKIR